MKDTLTLFLREGCGLCEQMLEELAPLQEAYGFRVAPVDVDADPALRALYDTRVPVLAGERGEICSYFLDPDAVARYFAKG